MEGKWYVGLLNFITCNSIPNVVLGKNNACPTQEGDTWKIISLRTGAYEIDDIEAYLKHVLIGNKITLRHNTNTLRCSLNIDFVCTEHSIGSMLGFIEKKLLDAHDTHWSNAPVNIMKVNTIKIRYNIVQ